MVEFNLMDDYENITYAGGKIKQKILREDFENITKVDCSGCVLLVELPLWPNVEEVDCSNCEYLTKLPLWPKLKKINCSKCPSLKILPDWPNVEIVNCSECPLLKKLPNWPNVEEVDCHNCEFLKNLPLWPNIGNVRCYECPLLKELPLWHHIQKVDCVGCGNLKKLPLWSNIEIISCKECPKLTLPLIPFVDFFCEPEKIKEMLQLMSNKLLIIRFIKKHKINTDDIVNSKQFEDFICPISCSLMIDPVNVSCGSEYDRSSIEKWLETSNFDPLTKEEITKEVHPVKYMSKMILKELEEFVKSKSKNK